MSSFIVQSTCYFQNFKGFYILLFQANDNELTKLYLKKGFRKYKTKERVDAYLVKKYQ